MHRREALICGLRAPAWLALGGMLFALASPANATVEPQWAVGYVARWAAAAREIAATDADRAGPQCGSLVRAAIDVDALSDGVATAVRASARQRVALRAAVKRKLVADCVRRRHAYDGAALTLLGVRETASQVLVTADVSFGERPSQRLVWTFASPTKRQPRALDVVAQGVSLAAETRNALAAMVRAHQGDLDQAIAALGAGQ